MAVEYDVSGTERGMKSGAHGSARARARRRVTSVGFVATYPPTKCGIATFTASLAESLRDTGHGYPFGVLSCVDRGGLQSYGPEVVGELIAGSRASLAAGAELLNRFDVVVVQHEFGIFGGEDGEEIIELLRRLTVPAIVVLHTVVADPSRNQQRIVHELAAIADRLVCQSKVALARLLASHTIPPGRIRIIPHGAPANLAAELRENPGHRPTVLTWGLIGPGKGIETAIDAVGLLGDLDPLPRYLVLGETHPRVIAASGESYRDSLQKRARTQCPDGMVVFDNTYTDTRTLLARVRHADIVLLPYLSRDQVVSGVLVEAIASGKPVVATSFPFAVEMLSQGSGIVVPHDDATALAAALRSLLTDRALSAEIRAAARRQAPTLFWSTVGQCYARLIAEVRSARRRVAA